MLVRSLIAALDRAESPRTVALVTRGLEWATGHSTRQVVQEWKAGGEGTIDYYARNGFYKLAGLYGGGTNYSGLAVTIESALELAAVYACVRIIAEDVGSLPFFPYERSRDGSHLEKAYGHPLYRILHDQPNPEMSAGQFREALTAQAALGCDGFARIDRDGNGKILYLWPFRVGTISTDRNKFNQIFYILKDGSSPEKTYNAKDIFHLKGFTLDGHRGDDILRRARHILGLGMAAQKYAGDFFANDASPGLLLERPAGLPPLNADAVRAVKAAWKEYHQKRSHEVGILQDGVVAKRLDPDHQKLQILESRRFQLIEVARLFRMPLHKIGDLDRSTNNNIEEQGIEYVQHTLKAPLRWWREAVWTSLLTDEERYWPSGRPRMYAQLNVEALQQGDFDTQTKGWAVMLEKGVLNIDEVRNWLDLNPAEKGGDVHRVQMQMVDIAAPPPPIAPLPQPQNAAA